jgi:hypothetical protein
MSEEKEKPMPLFKTEKRPPRVRISKEESMRRMENIGEWRKKRLAELRAELRAKVSR